RIRGQMVDDFGAADDRPEVPSEDVQLPEDGAGLHRGLDVGALARLQVIDRDDLGPGHQGVGHVTPDETRAAGDHDLRTFQPRDTTPGAYSRFLRRAQMRE